MILVAQMVPSTGSVVSGGFVTTRDGVVLGAFIGNLLGATVGTRSSRVGLGEHVELFDGDALGSLDVVEF
jgi:hypothetical protein